MKAKFAWLLVVVLMLTACVPIYETHYSYQPPDNPQEKSCIAQCQENRNVCRSDCHNQQQQCESQAREKAEFRYRMYKTKRQNAGKPLQKSLGDFYHTMGCHRTCNCQAEYRQCYRACGGKVIKHTHCIAFCDQAS
jgi:hypothetical protein